VIYSATLPGDSSLAFAATSGSPTLLSYNLNDYLVNMINSSSLASDPGTSDLSRWELLSTYVGVETENGTTADPDQGSVTMGLQISNSSVTTDADQTWAPAIPTNTFLLTNSDGSSSDVLGLYNGHLGFLSHDFGYSDDGSAAVNVTATQANSLISTGSGNDVLTASNSGTSILDGGTGLNILNGGTGTTWFVENGFFGGTTWDFIKDWHAGDYAIFFGYTPGSGKVSVESTLAGPGNLAGGTIDVTSGTGAIEKATFVGTPTSSLHTAYSTIDGVPALFVW
jgi:hypothetical protein